MVKKVLIILLGAFLIIFSCSCTRTENTSMNSLGEATTQSTIESVYLIEESEKNLICIELPTDYEFNEKQNIFIADFVSLKIGEISGETFELINSETAIKNSSQDYSGYYIDIESKTSYVSDDVISIVFTGILNKKSAAHPMHLLFALNFNPETMDVVKFSSRHIIDDALYNEFAQLGEKQVLEECGGKWPEDWGTFSEELCSKENFFEALKNENSNSSVNWYYTENGIGFSYSVVHALGGHKEVEIIR